MAWFKLANKGSVLGPLDLDFFGQLSPRHRRQSCHRTRHRSSNVSMWVVCRTLPEDGRDESRRLSAQSLMYELSLQQNNRVLTSRFFSPNFRLRAQVLGPRSLLAATLVLRRRSIPKGTPTASGNTTCLLFIMVSREESLVPD